MEKIVLSRPTYNRLSQGADLAQELANKATSPRGVTPAKPQHKHYMARLTTETTVPNGGLTWQAEEVYLDAVGAVVAKVGGFLWTDDNPVFTLNKAKKLDVIMVSQAGRPAIDPDPAKRYWFGNPGGGGGGGGNMYGKIKTNNGARYTADIYEVSNPSLNDTPILLDIEIYKNSSYGVFDVDFIHEVNLSTSGTPDIYSFYNLPVYGTCTVLTGGGKDYTGSVNISNVLINQTFTDVSIKAPSLNYGDLQANYSITGVFTNRWEISPALFGG